MLRKRYDPKVQRQLLMLNAIGLPIAAAILAGIWGLYFWRLHTFDRSIATIEALWEEEVYRRGKDIITMAELTYSNTATDGEDIECRNVFEIGRPLDGFSVGDRIEIVPATGTCQRIDVIGHSTEGK